MIRSEKGFTLIEIIAVLVILGILAAVAVPKYINMADEAKTAAAKGELAEVKSALNLAYAKLYLKNGSAPSLAAVVTESGLGSATLGTAPDNWSVSVTATGGITINSRNGDAKYTTNGTWSLPSSS